MKIGGSILFLFVACFIVGTESIPLDLQNAGASNSTSGKEPNLPPLTGAGNKTTSIDVKATGDGSAASPADNSTKEDNSADEKLSDKVSRPKCYNEKCEKGALSGCCAGATCTAADWEGAGEYRCLPKGGYHAHTLH